MSPSRPSLPRLAALGALGASAGIALLFLGFVWYSWPRGGGMDGTTRVLAWMSLGGVAVALIAVHVMFARKLSAVDREGRRQQQTAK